MQESADLRETVAGLSDPALFEHVDYIVSDGVATITINRPEVMNAFTPTTLRELIASVDRAASDRSVAVLVLTGAGDRAFCAGGDVNWEAEDEFETDIGIRLIKVLYESFRACLKPIIARVNGYAIGAGHHMAYMCDFTIAADHAIFGQNGARVGSPAEGWLVSYLATIVGMKRAKEIWILCRRYSAQQVYDWGLVNAVVPLSSLDDEVRKWCDEVMALSPSVVKFLKKSFDDMFEEVRVREDQTFYRELINPDFFDSGEHAEGAAAFLEKRKPDFSRWW